MSAISPSFKATSKKLVFGLNDRERDQWYLRQITIRRVAGHPVGTELVVEGVEALQLEKPRKALEGKGTEGRECLGLRDRLRVRQGSEVQADEVPPLGLQDPCALENEELRQAVGAIASPSHHVEGPSSGAVNGNKREEAGDAAILDGEGHPHILVLRSREATQGHGEAVL